MAHILCISDFYEIRHFRTVLFIPVLLSFPTLPRRLDFPMQRYSGRPASSTALLTARGFARQPSQIEDVLSSPDRHGMSVGLGIP